MFLEGLTNDRPERSVDVLNSRKSIRKVKKAVGSDYAVISTKYGYSHIRSVSKPSRPIDVKVMLGHSRLEKLVPRRPGRMPNLLFYIADLKAELRFFELQIDSTLVLIIVLPAPREAKESARRIGDISPALAFHF